MLARSRQVLFVAVLFVAAGAAGACGGRSSLSASSGAGGSECQCAHPGTGLYCGAAACAGSSMAVGSTSTAGTTSTVSTMSTSSSGGCVGEATFAGKASSDFPSTSLWAYKGLLGLAAGNLACSEIGADHVCDYDDLGYAVSKGELAALTSADDAWLQRTHPVTVGATSPKIITAGGVPGVLGTTYQAGAGSRCGNWTYAGEHLNDGEWVDFENGGADPIYHLDDNPCVIEMPIGGKDAPCGHGALIRSVLCCYAKNGCNPPVALDDCPCLNGQCQ